MRRKEKRHELKRARQTLRISTEAHELGEVGQEVVENARSAVCSALARFAADAENAPDWRLGLVTGSRDSEDVTGAAQLGVVEMLGGLIPADMMFKVRTRKHAGSEFVTVEIDATELVRLLGK